MYFESYFYQLHKLLICKIGLAVRAAETDNWVSMSEVTFHQGVGGSTRGLGANR